MKSSLRRYCLASAGIAALAMPAAAFAQAQPIGPAGAQAAAQDSDANSPADVSRDIVVTGSRIVRGGFEQPTPVAVVTTAELIKTAPGNIAEGLNQLPVFQNSINNNQQQFTQGNRQRTGNYLNLRSLGTQRVLVLLDGQRLPPSGTNGGVDVNLIPQLLTQRVDVVTGGASAVYGSDAVSGVVNFVIDSRFKGLKAQAQRGISSRGDNGSYRLSLAGGVSLLDDRLHLIASAERFHSDGLQKSDRPIIARSIQTVGAGTSISPFFVADNIRFGVLSDGGVLRDGPFANTRQFDANGNLIPFNRGTVLSSGQFQGGDSAIVGSDCCTITPSSTASQVFGRATYEVTDNVEVFAQAGYNWSSNSDNPIPFIRTDLPIFQGNAFLTPAQNATIFPASGQLRLGKIMNYRPGTEITQYSDSLYINTGIKAEFGGLHWTAGYIHGETKFRTTNVTTDNQKLYAALDAVRDPSGNIVCRATLTNPGLYPGCVPLNVFGTGRESDAAYNYILGVSEYKVVNKMDSFQASVAGDLFEGWAGPISFAFGGEYRKQSLRQTSNSDPALLDTPAERAAYFAGLRGVAAGDLKFGGLNISPASGSYNVKEVFAELNVPVLKDSAVGSLELNGAGRVTDYSTSGTVKTWKIGGLYDPIDGVRFRATYSRDIRAPTLFELFGGQTISTLVVNDRQTGNPTATTRGIAGSNANLDPEIAKTFTAGLVLKPSFVPGLSVSADYYDIKISDAITTPYSAFQALDLCTNSQGTAPACSQISRDANGQLTEIRTLLENVAVTSLSGIDVEARYSRPLGSGRLNLSASANRLISFEQQNAPGQPISQFEGTSDFNDVQFPLPLPKWRAAFNLGYENDWIATNVQERVIGGYKRSAQFVYVDNDVPAVWYTDFNLTFKVKAGNTNFELFGTVNNLFDKDAPIVPVTRTPGLTVPTIRSTYDIIGRYITIGARVRL